MRRAVAVLHRHIWPVAEQYFPTLSLKRHDFRGAGGGSYIEHKMCFDVRYNFSFLILRRIERCMIKNVEWS